MVFGKTKRSEKQPEAVAPEGRSLGPLETVVMEVFWEQGEATVRDVYDVMRARREIAYTTVLSTTRSLFAKGFLDRHLQGKAHLYRPRFSRHEFTRSRVSRTIDELLDRFTEPALVHFLDRLAYLDEAKLDDLEKLIEARRLDRHKTSEGTPQPR